MARSLAPQRRSAPSAVLHGIHPLRGYPVTWHLTPITPVSRHPHAQRGATEFLVERADGLIDDPTAWDLAEKESAVLTTAEACALVRRISRPMH